MPIIYYWTFLNVNRRLSWDLTLKLVLKFNLQCSSASILSIEAVNDFNTIVSLFSCNWEFVFLIFVFCVWWFNIYIYIYIYIIFDKSCQRSFHVRCLKSNLSDTYMAKNGFLVWMFPYFLSFLGKVWTIEIDQPSLVPPSRTRSLVWERSNTCLGIDSFTHGSHFASVWYIKKETFIP